ncbi:carbon-phosphorus lyase complex subunit PhnI [Natronorubrum sp. DTA7]|uniref:carbon-phosphorus lyase complex subunit PhnI n=1 Tax=Natronorubrum sp. DTA7 TaxID=3447016 RepID=UPI003F83DA61
MGYVAVEAGEETIRKAEKLFEKARIDGDAELLSVDQIDEQLGRLTSQVMGEAGLYAPRLAAIAIKQAQGDTVEAAFLLRAYRSTLELWGYAEPVTTDEMIATRRVSPAFKDVPGGQILGGTKDYTQRLLDFDLDGADSKTDPTATWEVEPESPEQLRNVVDLLREEGLLPALESEPTDAESEPTDAESEPTDAESEPTDAKSEPTDAESEPTDANTEPDEPYDTTRRPVTHPAPRSAVLQELSRGETGAVTALGYSVIRGYGQVHPTLGEAKTGRLPVRIEHPYTGEPVEVTTVEISETESVVPVYAKRDDPQFSFGYGLVFGRNERKAIAMSMLDAAIQLDGDEPAEDAEFVLDLVDGMDSFGFIEHLKLPHYVTFQSILDRIRSIRAGQNAGESERGETGERSERTDEPPQSDDMNATNERTATDDRIGDESTEQESDGETTPMEAGR